MVNELGNDTSLGVNRVSPLDLGINGGGWQIAKTTGTAKYKGSLLAFVVKHRRWKVI
jgi:hypothetical protein